MGSSRKVAGLTPDERVALEAAADAYVAAMNAEDWARVAQAFAADGVRVPLHEEPHRGHDAIEAWLGGIEELIAYELKRDEIGGADGFAYIRGRYAITLRPTGAPGPISDEGDFLEVWRLEPDGAWRISQAMWNTRMPVDSR